MTPRHNSGSGRAGRIASVEVQLADVPLEWPMSTYGSTVLHIVLVRVTGDDDCSGTGFTYTLTDGASVVPVMITDVLAPLIIGTKSDEWSSTYDTLWSRTRRLGPTVFAPAISALDIAVWDLRSTRADVPLWDFLGREPTTTRMYGSGRSGASLTTQELRDGATWYVDRGFTALKIRVGTHGPQGDVARVAAVRQVVGPKVQLMVDANERLDLEGALELCSGLSELGVSWIEEPFDSEALSSHAALAASNRVGVATGEHLVTPAQFADVVRARAATLLQPDATLCGGITQALRISEVARTGRTPISFHAFPELHVHLAAGDDNVILLEHFPLLQHLIDNPLLPDSGMASAPRSPGIGIAWNAEFIDRHTVSAHQA